VVVRAHPVVDEVKRLVVKYQVIHDDVVRRHASVESREYGDVGGGDDDDTPGERDTVDDAWVTTRLVRAHPVLPKLDVVAAGDQDARAG